MIMLLGSRLLTGAAVVVGVPALIVGYIALVEWLVTRLPFVWQPKVRPWLWLLPALVILGFFLLYPAVDTFYLSLFDTTGKQYVGLQNYTYFFTTQGTLIALRNTAYWLIFLSIFTVALGLIFAVLFDRVKYEAAAKGILFLPMAISFTAASIIWKLQYDYQPPGAAQTGTLNQIITLLGGQPVAWMVDPRVNNLALNWVGIWMWTGFALVILSAGLKSIPGDIIEAARVDGANEWQILRSIMIPMMSTTIIVVGTTMVINALKIFDIIYVMTGGFYNTDVLAVHMYIEMFDNLQFGRASAVATLLLITIIPFMLINIRRFREQEAMR
jgi:alpha-glucoside transport system permease protein